MSGSAKGSRGSPGEVQWHGRGVFSKLRKRDGKRVFFIQYWYRGRRLTEKVGLRLDRARGRVEARREAIDNGKAPPAALKSAKRVRFREYAKTFLDDYRGRGGKGVRSKHYPQHSAALAKHFGKFYLDEIDAEEVDRYARRLRLAPTTIRKRLTVLGTMLDQARTWGLLDTVPKIRKPGASDGRVPYRDLSPEEWRRLVETIRAADDARPWELPLFRFALATASHRQEALNLRWDDIRDGAVYMWQGKTDHGKKVPVGEAVRSILDKRRPFRFSGYVFCGSRGGRLSDRFVSFMVA